MRHFDLTWHQRYLVFGKDSNGLDSASRRCFERLEWWQRWISAVQCQKWSMPMSRQFLCRGIGEHWWKLNFGWPMRSPRPAHVTQEHWHAFRLQHNVAVCGLCSSGWLSPVLTPRSRLWAGDLGENSGKILVVSNVLFSISYMRCHPSHWLVFFKMVIAPPTMWVIGWFADEV